MGMFKKTKDCWIHATPSARNLPKTAPQTQIYRVVSNLAWYCFRVMEWVRAYGMRCRRPVRMNRMLMYSMYIWEYPGSLALEWSLWRPARCRVPELPRGDNYRSSLSLFSVGRPVTLLIKCFLESVTGILILRKKIKANSHICQSYRKEIKSGRNMMLGKLLVSTFQEGTQKTMSRPIWWKPRREDRRQIRI